MINGKSQAAKQMEDERLIAWGERLIDSPPEFI
jgi:hypothetical protein